MNNIGNILNILKPAFDFYLVLFLVVWVFWLIYVRKKVLFWVWLWQLKEYRRDRMKAHFQLGSSRKIFLNKVYFIKVILLVLLLICFFLNFKNLIVFVAAAAFYSPLILASLISGRKQIQKPISTQKARLLDVLNLVFFVFLIPVLFFAIFPGPFYLEYFIVLVFFDIFLPAVVMFFLALITLPVNFQKNRITRMAKEKIEGLKENILVIGVTGSYGKTSTKEFLAEILSSNFKVCKTEANNNTEMGVAKTVLEKLSKNHEIFIVEMAAYKRGEVKRICDIVRPSVGIITGIGSQHFSLFGSQENIIKAKYELIESLPDKGLAIFNGDSNFFLDIFKKTKKPKKFYSLNNPHASLYAENIKEFEDRVEFMVCDGGEETEFRANLIGKQNIPNILGALLVAQELGIKIEANSTKEIVQNLKPFPRTMELKAGVNGMKIIDDSYSGNFEGAISAIEYLKNYQNNKKVIILYPLIELGALARDIHKKIGRKIGEICDFCILVNKDFAKEVKAGAMESGMEEQKIKIIEKPSEVVKQVKDFARKGDVVLLENRIPSEIINSLVI